MLAKAFPRELVDEVIDAAGARERRRRVLQAWLTLYFTLALGSLKAQTKGPGVVLRSKTPDGAVQEIWALLCAYHAVRELTSAAAALARQDPPRICFINALVMLPLKVPAADLS